MGLLLASFRISHFPFPVLYFFLLLSLAFLISFSFLVLLTMASSSTSSFSSGSKPKPIITVLCCHCGLPNQLTLTAEANQGFSCWDCQMPQYVMSVEDYEAIYLKKSRKSFSFFSKKKQGHSETSHVAISIEDKNAIDAMKSMPSERSDSVPASAQPQSQTGAQQTTPPSPPPNQSNGSVKPPVKGKLTHGTRHFFPLSPF